MSGGTVTDYKTKEREYLSELKKAREAALSSLEEINRKIEGVTGGSVGVRKSGSTHSTSYNISPLGKEVIIKAANLRGLKLRVTKGEAPKSELVAAEKELKEVKVRAVAERKRLRNAKVREARRLLSQKRHNT
jgi:hypothetical protein